MAANLNKKIWTEIKVCKHIQDGDHQLIGTKHQISAEKGKQKYKNCAP